MRPRLAEFSPPLAENDFEKNLFGNIETFGWHAVHVAAENVCPSFAYTIGHFWKQSHPEIIVLGLRPEIAQQLLVLASDRIVGQKATLKPFQPYSDFTQGLKVVLLPVDLEHYGQFLGYANWFYRKLKTPYPVLQLVWPDKGGFYPWDIAFDKRFLEAQPILGSFGQSHLSDTKNRI